ncbi:ATP-binding protein [Streptomyces sp. NPDC048156]|uniref:ATP-binding protein n=1 Tax=Streptomyces sp. NPDC048156 TaxID=3365502 RepID=UPI00371EB6CE
MNEQTEQHAYTLHLTVGTHSARHVRRIVRALCEDWAEVSDEGAALPPEAPHSVDTFAESGRGLAIVSAVVTKWGVQPLAVGRTVRFECVASSA